MWEENRDELEIAEHFSKFAMDGTRFLTFRDVPQLVKKHVTGTISLDYGCGPGHSTMFLKSHGLTVDGVDISEAMIRCAKKYDSTGVYNVIDSAVIPTEDQHYDFVFVSYVLQHVSNKNEMVKILREIVRVLRNGGTTILVVSNTNTYKTQWNSLDCNFEENKTPTGGSIVKVGLKDIGFTCVNYYWTDRDYRDVISASGLKIVAVHNPLGTDYDGYKWVSEKEISPATIYVAKKL